jgi:predicted transcriptional regulator
MKRALLISIHPEWAEKILNGEKTIEIRTWIPKDYAGWVYVYITKDNYKNHLYKKDDIWTLTEKNIFHYPYKNICGKVVAKFTLNYVSTCLNTDYGNEEILKNACLTKQELDDYVGKRKFFAWHIDKLEIFDKPKELSEFIHYRKETIYCGMDCPPYTDWVEYPVRKAPQKCAWVYLN